MKTIGSDSFFECVISHWNDPQRDFSYLALFHIFVQHIFFLIQIEPLLSILFLTPPIGGKQEKLNFVTNKKYGLFIKF